MSGEAQKTEAEINAEIDKSLEASADAIFGGEPVAADETTPVDGQAPIEKASDGEPGDDGEESREDEEETSASSEGKDEELSEEEKAAAEKEAAEKAEADDPYKVPDDLKGRTKERFEKLTTDLKTAHEEGQKKDDIIKGFKEVLDSTGLNPKELQRTLDLGAMLKSNPAKALEVLQGVVSDLSSQLGVVPPGRDPLEGFTDLQQRVADRELSQEDATELAKARIKEKAVQEEQARQAEKQRKEKDAVTSQQQREAQVNGVKQEIAAFLVEAEKDPDWDKISGRIVDAAKFANENLAPDKWLGYIKGEHKKIKDLATELAPVRSGGTPLVEGGAAPTGGKEPKNLEELADQML